MKPDIRVNQNWIMKRIWMVYATIGLSLSVIYNEKEIKKGTVWQKRKCPLFKYMQATKLKSYHHKNKVLFDKYIWLINEINK